MFYQHFQYHLWCILLAIQVVWCYSVQDPFTAWLVSFYRAWYESLCTSYHILCMYILCILAHPHPHWENHGHLIMLTIDTYNNLHWFLETTPQNISHEILSSSISTLAHLHRLLPTFTFTPSHTFDQLTFAGVAHLTNFGLTYITNLWLTYLYGADLHSQHWADLLNPNRTHLLNQLGAFLHIQLWADINNQSGTNLHI